MIGEEKVNKIPILLRKVIGTLKNQSAIIVGKNKNLDKIGIGLIFRRKKNEHSK